MLTLKIGNTFISTREVDIPVVLRSPLFTEEGHAPGSFIFNFTAPLTDELKHELAFAHRPTRKGKPQYKHPFLLIFGILRYSGIANITELSDNEVSINMPVDSGDLSILLAEKKLTDLPITDQVVFDPQITFADCAKPYSYWFNQQHLFVHDVWIKPNIIRIDTFNGFSVDDHHWVCPSSNTYTVNLIINWSFGLFDYLGSTYPAGETPVFRLYKNDVVIATGSIEMESFIYKNSFAFIEGDTLTVSLRAVSVASYGQHVLSVRIDSGSSIAVYIEELHFHDAIHNAFPGSPYCLYPFSNPNVLDNVPDSLFRVDFNDIKDQITKYSDVVNYYLNDNFPLVISGFRDSRYFALLNLFSPAVYIAFIIRKILELINYTAVNNVFESPSMSRICMLSNSFINNYSYDGESIWLVDFLPDLTIKEFFSSLCHSLGISYTVNANAREITFSFISDIIDENSSLKFDSAIVGNTTLSVVVYDSFSLSLIKPDCSYISSFSKSFEGLNILDSVNTFGQLPKPAQLNDCRYVVNRKSWFYFNYDEDQGEWNWIFLTMDFPFELASTPDTSLISSFDIKLPFSSTLNDFYHPTKGAGDRTIGAPLNRLWTIPAFHTASNYKQLPGAYKSDVSFCIHLYHGLQQDSQSNDYPLASNDIYDYSGNPMAGAGQSLRLDTPFGLYEKCFKSFIDLNLDSPGEYRLHKILSLPEISSLNWFLWHDVKGVKYLLKEIKFNIKHDHLTPAEIIAIRK